MKIFDSKTQSLKIEETILKLLENSDVINKKKLAIIQVGDDTASSKFIDIKIKLGKSLGILCEVYKINEKNCSDDEIFLEIINIFKNEDIAGGIVQLPLPRESLYKILDIIPLEKDIDLISTKAKERFYSDDFSKLSPVIQALKNFSLNCDIDYKGLQAVVIGDGELVGKPISFYLSKKGADVKMVLNYKSGEKIDCDLLVLAAGIPNLVKGENISEGCDVVDFGSSVVDGKCVGDLDMTSSLEHLGCVSKSPGGMGPLVVRYLLLNFLDKIQGF